MVLFLGFKLFNQDKYLIYNVNGILCLILKCLSRCLSLLQSEVEA